MSDCYNCRFAVDEETGKKGRYFVRCMAETKRKGRVAQIYRGKRPGRYGIIPAWCPERRGKP